MEKNDKIDEDQQILLTDLRNQVYDLIRTINDPEKPNTLEELNVVDEEGVSVSPIDGEEDAYLIRIEFIPTVPHCSLATLIGLSLRVKLERDLLQKFKLDVYIRKGSHSSENEINKQINDKERIAAAMENPNLLALVNTCLKEVE